MFFKYINYNDQIDKIMKKIFLLLFFAASAQLANAQAYQTSIGLRAGVAPGITLKHFVNPNAAFEGILTTRGKGINITGLYEWHGPLGEVPNFFWYVGGGAHIGFWDDNSYSRDEPFTGSYFIIGLDGILGMEYTFEEIPLNLSLDWKPTINIIERSGFWGDELAISVRYIISGRSAGNFRGGRR